MLDAFRSDPAHAAGRILGRVIFSLAYGGRGAAAPAGREEEIVDEVAGALNACLERFFSPAVLFDPLTRRAVVDADTQLTLTPVDVKALDGDLDSIRARLHLLEKRGLDHLPEYAYLSARCEELTQRWRESCHAQGEPTSMRPVPTPEDAEPDPTPPELSALSSMYR